jgi:hypothetical protein
VPKKKIWANFHIIIELFTKKIVKQLLKIWSWDPGSEIRKPGVKKTPDPGSATLRDCICALPRPMKLAHEVFKSFLVLYQTTFGNFSKATPVITEQQIRGGA